MLRKNNNFRKDEIFKNRNSMLSKDQIYVDTFSKI